MNYHDRLEQANQLTVIASDIDRIARMILMGTEDKAGIYSRLYNARLRLGRIVSQFGEGKPGK
jgi:hypothetical protein